MDSRYHHKLRFRFAPYVPYKEYSARYRLSFYTRATLPNAPASHENPGKWENLHTHACIGPFQTAAVPAQGKAYLSTSTILLIDDNAVQAATRKEILKRSDYFVIAVLSPQRALEQFRNAEFPEDIDLVITDHVMPGMSGAAFVTALRELHPSMPVMVISGLEEAEDEYAGLNVTFRLKPLLPDSLLENVRLLLHKETLPSS